LDTARIDDVRILRILAVLVSALTLALAASGCGGKETTYEGTSPEDWAAQVCGALSDWARGLQADSQTLTAQLRNSASIRSVKVKFVAFLDRAGKSADTMAAKVKAAGAPAVKDGEKLQAELEAALDRAHASFDRAKSKARNLSDIDPQAFTTGVQSLGADVQQELTAIGREFEDIGERYDDEALNEATDNEPTCQQVSAAS
jgi:hypothetical protein